MKKRYKFLIGNLLYVIFFALVSINAYNKYGLDTEWTYPLSQAFTLGIFMFNLIPFLMIMLKEGITNSGDVG